MSQLAALKHAIMFTRFSQDDTSVSLAPHPLFLAKNEREGHRLGPVSFPMWKENGGHHTLCPVAALREYMERRRGEAEERL